jgi:hypothetical protein
MNLRTPTRNRITATWHHSSTINNSENHNELTRNSKQTQITSILSCSLSTVTWLRAEREGFDSRKGRGRDFFSSAPHSDRLWSRSSLLSTG